MKSKKHIDVKKTVQTSSEWIFQFWAWQLLVWTLYRYFFHMPEWVDEYVIKPFVFVLPVLFFVIRKEKNSLQTIGITAKRWIQYVGIGVGIALLFFVEGIVATYVKTGSVPISFVSHIGSYSVLSLFFLSLATACSEELLNRGFLFSRLLKSTKKLWFAVIMSTLMFMAFHIPILVTTLQFHGATLMLYFWTTLILGVVNSLIYYQTESLIIPILIHLSWNMMVVLFL